MHERPELSMEPRKEAEKTIVDFHASEMARYSAGQIPEVLKSLENGEITREQLTELIATRYQAAHFFEDMLKRLIDRIENDSSLSEETKSTMKKSVQQNLDEEMGLNADYGGPHVEGREDLLKALNRNYEEWKSKLGDYNNLGELEDSAKAMIEEMKRIIDESSVAGLAALYNYEDRISLDGIGDYYILLKGLEKLFPEFKKDKYVEGDEFWHIYSHADHDEHHAALAKRGILAGVSNPTDLEKIK